MSGRALPMDERLLIELWPTRLPERLLVVRLGRCSSAIYRRAAKLGLPASRIAIRESRDGISKAKRRWLIKQRNRAGASA